ncbi:MAG: hypothetical protein HQM15_08280 [Deltaproteobacteria bacterium]|nr:hypothetical protein [Deltaproteobacteria bacterium]
MGIIIDDIRFTREVPQPTESETPSPPRRHHGRSPAASESSTQGSYVADVIFREEGNPRQHHLMLRRTAQSDPEDTNIFPSTAAFRFFRDFRATRFVPMHFNEPNRPEIQAINHASLDLSSPDFQHRIFIQQLLSDPSLGVPFDLVLGGERMQTMLSQHEALYRSLRLYVGLNEANVQDDISLERVRTLFSGLGSLSYAEQDMLQVGFSALLTGNRPYINDVDTFTAVAGQPGALSRTYRILDALSLLHDTQRAFEPSIEDGHQAPRLATVPDLVKAGVHQVAAQLVSYLYLGTPPLNSFGENLISLATELYRLSPANNRYNLLEVIQADLMAMTRAEGRGDFFRNSANQRRLTDLRNLIGRPENAERLRLALLPPEQAFAQSLAARLVRDNILTPRTPHPASENISVPSGFNQTWLNQHLPELVLACLNINASGPVHPLASVEVVPSTNAAPAALRINVGNLRENLNRLIQSHPNERSLYQAAALAVARHLFGNGQPRDTLTAFYRNGDQTFHLTYDDRAQLNGYYNSLIANLARDEGASNAVRDWTPPIAAAGAVLGGVIGATACIYIASHDVGCVPGEPSVGGALSVGFLAAGTSLFLGRVISPPSTRRNVLITDLLYAGTGAVVGVVAGGGIPWLLPTPTPPAGTPVTPPPVMPPRPATGTVIPSGNPTPGSP